MATAENDSRLIERVGRGDREAFEQLYKRFARPVLAMALRQLGDNGRAEDAAQETFAAVWRSAKSYRAERGTASAWLYAVARHAIIDRARQKRENAAEAPDEADVRAGPAERAEESWLTWRVHSALELLARARARRHRARLLERSLPDRDRELPGRAARDRQDANADRSRPPGRPARGGKGMSDTPDFRELVGDDLTPEEELELARVDSLLRSVPGPVTEVPGSLTHAVERIGTARPIWTRRRVFVAVALAATVAALFFGAGRWLDRGFDARASVQMTPGTSAPNASAKIELGPRDDATGNWRMRIVVDGLPHLEGNDYYVLWLAKDGEYAGACGTFNVSGRTTVDLTASYDLSEYDAWVITRKGSDSPWLLSAET